jgi:DNA-binding MarR family transcriptional regulator
MYNPGSPENSVGFWLKQAQHSFHSRMEEALRPLGLTVSQYAVLAQLAAHPGLSNADLARRAFITAQSMQGVLANLESAGLVQRTADAAHGRRQPASVTPEGATLLSAAHVLVGALEAKLVAAAAPLASDEALALLARIRAAFS